MSLKSPHLRLEDFDFQLPYELIAQFPLRSRTQSRLLIVDSQSRPFRETKFSRLNDLLQPGDLMVLNDSKVIPARLLGTKTTGGRVEILLERILNELEFTGQAKASKGLKLDQIITITDQFQLSVTAKNNTFYTFALVQGADVFELFEHCGNVPLPPYIKRSAEIEDASRYQTVYAKSRGSVAAPTAGLHFDEKLMQEIRLSGVEFTHLTLHVGAGTFSPVRTCSLENQALHPERIFISESTVSAVRRAQKRGSRVIAVGTTVMRALESAARTGELQPTYGETNLFITPGFKFRIVQALITNFHLPRSSLIMLVCAFGGTERILRAYRHAVKQRFRFYSYGDAMFVQPRAD